jgi:hypothetical protein
VGTVRFDRPADRRLRVAWEPVDNVQAPLLPKFAADYFQTEHLPDLRQQLRLVDERYLVGRWTMKLRGPSEKLLRAGSPRPLPPGEGEPRRLRSLLPADAHSGISHPVLSENCTCTALCAGAKPQASARIAAPRARDSPPAGIR